MQSDEEQRGLPPPYQDTIATIAQAWARNLSDTSIEALVRSLESKHLYIFRSYPHHATRTQIRLAKYDAVRKWLAYRLGQEEKGPPVRSLQEDYARDPSCLTDALCAAVVKDMESKAPDFFNKHAVDGALPTQEEKLEIVREILADKLAPSHDTGAHPGSTQPGSI